MTVVGVQAGGVWLALTGLLLLWPGGMGTPRPVLAGESSREPLAEPDRPDVANSATVVPPRLALLESGWAFARTRGAGGEKRLTLPFALRLGLLADAELNVSGDFLRYRTGGEDSAAGIGDVLLGGKLRLRDGEEWGPAIGVQPFVKFPAASHARELGSGKVDYSLTLLVDQDLPGGLQATFNAGAAALGKPDQSQAGFRFQHTLALTLAYPIGPANPFVQVAWASPADAEGGRSLITGPGLLFRVGWRLVLDLGLTLGLRAADDRLQLFGGASVLFGPSPANAGPPNRHGAPRPHSTPGGQRATPDAFFLTAEALGGDDDAR
ncbi:MAG: transporter [Deltaproteobacteria bacterium]|nr:transporter [Deltaproteobacteria bacterium]MBI3079614.1 transporter [Deltaproteobacteria bacterium]